MYGPGLTFYAVTNPQGEPFIQSLGGDEEQAIERFMALGLWNKTPYEAFVAAGFTVRPFHLISSQDYGYLANDSRMLDQILVSMEEQARRKRRKSSLNKTAHSPS